MVGERRNGNLLVQLGPKLQAYPEELIRQRRTHDGQTEYLIRWCLVAIDDGSTSGGGASEAGGTVGVSSGVGGSVSAVSGETKPENILMWMSTEDVYANCPTLLGKRKMDSQRPLQQEKQRGGEASDSGISSGTEFPSDVTFDEVELSDMKEDVKNLVCRARKQMAKKSDFSINIMHTIHVLSAYASIGSLVGVFKETGALNLLMELLCNKETQTRRSAGKMLRALASHDAGKQSLNSAVIGHRFSSPGGLCGYCRLVSESGGSGAVFVYSLSWTELTAGAAVGDKIIRILKKDRLGLLCDVSCVLRFGAAAALWSLSDK